MKKLDFSYKNELSKKHYTLTEIKKFHRPQVFIKNPIYADISEKDLHALLEESDTISQVYSGHQFGRYNPQLGDGRAHLIGEYSFNEERFDLMFKGSGKTVYSRGGDGLSPLKAAIREYLISFAMKSYDIPTTETIAVYTTNEKVLRNEIENGGIVLRKASSHIRIGTFEYFSYHGYYPELEQLYNYTLKRHYPNAKSPFDFLEQFAKKNSKLIAKWMSIGFIHGVMNTDNIAISGETIDFGPCAFMNSYNPDQVYSSIDINGRYSYINQKDISIWNLYQLTNALLPLINEDPNRAIKEAQDFLHSIEHYYESEVNSIMAKKIGLYESNSSTEKFISDFLGYLQTNKLDFTKSFYDLPQFSDDEIQEKWNNLLIQNNQTLEGAQKLMKTVNPYIIPRNAIVEEMLSSADQGDLKSIREFELAFKNPYQANDHTKLLDQKHKDLENFKTFCGT